MNTMRWTLCLTFLCASAGAVIFFNRAAKAESCAIDRHQTRVNSAIHTSPIQVNAGHLPAWSKGETMEERLAKATKVEPQKPWGEYRITDTPPLSAELPESYAFPPVEDVGERTRDSNPLDQGADNCPATVISSLPYTDAGTTVGLVSNWDTADDCGADTTTGAPDVIYSLTPTVTGVYEIGLCGSVSYNNLLEVRTSGGCPGAVQIACNTNGCNGNSAALYLTLNSGQTYYIIVDGHFSASGTYELYVNGSCSVAMQGGDIIECAEVQDSSHARLDCDGGCANSQWGGTPSFQNVSAGQTVYGTGFNYVRNGVNFRDTDWYRVTLTDTARLKVTMETEFRSRLHLYSGNCPGSTVDATFPSACFPGTVITDCLLPGTYIVTCSPETFSAVPVPLHYRCTIETIECAGCVDASLLYIPNYFTSFGSGTCSDDNSCPADAANDYLYEVLIPEDGEWSFLMCMDGIPPVPLWNSRMYLNTSCCGGTIASNDDGCSASGFSRIECVPLTAGMYFLLIDGATPADCGNHTLLIDQCEGRCCYSIAGDSACEVMSAGICTTLFGGIFTPGEDCSFGCAGRITLADPNGGENWLTGENDTIRWTGGSGNVSIELNRTYPSMGWESLSNSTPSDGEFVWTVTPPLTSAARVRVSMLTDLTNADTSDADFSILYPGPDTLWTRRHSEVNTTKSYASVVQLPGFVYLLGGSIDPPGAALSDAMVVLADPNGDILRQYSFGGAGADFGSRVVRDAFDTDKYVLAATTASFGAGSNDFWIVKLDDGGNTIWSQTYGGAGNDAPSWIQQTADGGYILVGITTSFGAGGGDVWMVKLDSDGNDEWSMTHGGTGGDVGREVLQTSDGGYIIAGSTTSFGALSQQCYIIKTDDSGFEEWHYITGGAFLDQFSEVEELPDGNFVFAGLYGATSTNADIFMLWMNSHGAVTDSAIIDRGEVEFTACLLQRPDGLVVTGSSHPFDQAQQDFFWAKTDFSGNLTRYREYGLAGSSGRDATIALPDNGYLMAGQTTTDAYLIRLGGESVLPCPAADSLVVKHFPGFLSNIVVRWKCNQTGNYRVYSTTNTTLNTNPPGAGWTLEGEVAGTAGTRAFQQDFLFNDPALYKRYVVQYVCP